MRGTAAAAILVAAMLTGCGTSGPSADRGDSGSGSGGPPSAPPASSSTTPPAGTTKTANQSGVVKWFSEAKGVGLITRTTGEDIMVHSGDVTAPGGILKQGEKVAFDIKQGPRGLQAVNVSVYG